MLMCAFIIRIYRKCEETGGIFFDLMLHWWPKSSIGFTHIFNSGCELLEYNYYHSCINTDGRS